MLSALPACGPDCFAARPRHDNDAFLTLLILLLFHIDS